MIIHEFVNGEKPIMVLIHGVLTPWQVWTPHVDLFKEQYNIYVIALNSHTEERASEFVSVLAEAEQIVKFFKERNIDTIDALCGLSLGGKIAHEIWKSDKLKIRNLVMDGAPLVACPKIAIKIMIRNYKNILQKSRKRDTKILEQFKSFLPEKYLESYLKIADLFTDKAIENIVNSVFSGGKLEGVNNRSRILFVHGTKGNEILSKKSAKLIKKYYPAAEVVCFKGDAHCYKAIFQPKKWTEVVGGFLQKQ